MKNFGLSSARLRQHVQCDLKRHVTPYYGLRLQPNKHVHFRRFHEGTRTRMSRASDATAPTQSHRAAIALGSNLGDRVSYIEQALRLLNESAIKVVQTSPLYETKAMYYQDQGSFINGVSEIATDKEPLDLLDTLQGIEKKLGRQRSIEKGPRTIDLDIITYDERQMEVPRLTLPHPGLPEREFVLRPLNDILPRLAIPSRESGIWTSQPVSILYNHLKHRDDSMSPVTQLAFNLHPIRSTDPARTTQVMAVLNLTPDSFSDGGVHDGSNLEKLRATALEFIALGTTILDVGGQSTRPGAQQLSASEELERILPAINMIRSMPEAKSMAISIDTFHASVAREALAAGADIINDISGGMLSNNEILSVVAEAGKSIVLMHMRGDPATMNQLANYPRGVVTEVAEELRSRIDAALSAGVPPWRIMLDPGIGFAKNMDHNLILLKRLAELRASPLLGGFSWLLGTSRKGFIGKITGVANASERVMGTAATVTASIAGGADVVRVHDVKAMTEVVRMSDAIYRRPSTSENEPT